MKLTAIRDLLRCEVLAGVDRLEIEVDTVVASDGMSVILATPHPGALMVTGLTNIQSVRTAVLAYIPAVVYVRGNRPDRTAVEFAEKKGIALLATALGMFDTCGILRDSSLKGAT